MSETTEYIGLITAPGYPKEIGARLQNELPSLLDYYVKEEVEWKIDYIEDPLLGGGANSKEILEATKEKKEEKEWDYAVCLTDIPLFIENRMIVAEANEDENIALISMPSFGSTFMIRRLRESIMQLVNEMYYGSSEESRERSALRIESKRSKHKGIDVDDSKNLMTSRFLGWLSPLKRETPNDGEEEYLDVRFTVGRRGSISIRLLAGMVRAIGLVSVSVVYENPDHCFCYGFLCTCFSNPVAIKRALYDFQNVFAYCLFYIGDDSMDYFDSSVMGEEAGSEYQLCAKAV